MTRKSRYIPNPLQPTDPEGKDKYLAQELEKIGQWSDSTSGNFGDEGANPPTDPGDPVPPPGHIHDHRNLVGVFPDQHHPQFHELGSHTDVTIEVDNLKKGQGLWYNSETGQWSNRAAAQESWPTGLANGGELNIVLPAGDVEVIAGLGVVVDSYTNPLAPPLLKGLQWDLINEPITAAPAVAGSIVWVSIYDTGVAAPASAPSLQDIADIPINIGALRQYAQPPGPSLAKAEIFLGVLVHNGVQWKEVSNPKVINQTAETLREIATTVLPLTSIISGGEISEQPAFTLNQAEGVVWENNRNWHVDKSNPNREALPAALPITFQYVNRDFTSVGTPVTVVDPSTYDDGGVVTPVPGPANTATIQRLYLDPANNYWMLYGQEVYANFDVAMANLYAEVPEVPFILQNSILLGFVVSEKAKTDWDVDEAIFVSNQGAVGTSGGGAPITEFINLSDTPVSYTGEKTKVPVTNIAETALEFDYRASMIPYVNGATYYPQDTVYQDGWLMSANKETTDNPVPQPIGDPTYALPETPAFNTLSEAVVVTSGHQYTFSTAGYFRGLRVWVPDASSGSITYRITVVRGPNTANPSYTIIDTPLLASNTWNLIAADTILVAAGEELLVYIDSLNSGGSTPITGGWQRAANSNDALVDPGLSQWGTNNAQTLLRINDTDLDTVNRSTELQGVIAGSTIEIVDTVDPQKSLTYLVQTNAVDRTTHFSWDVSLQDTGVNGAPEVADICTINIDVPIAQATNYSTIPSYWDAGTLPTWGTIQSFLQFDGVAQPVVGDEAYGVDVSFQGLTKSDDWDIFGVPGGGGGGESSLEMTSGGFNHKPVGEPIFLIGTGQSNMGGYEWVVDSTMQKNSKVFDWTTGGSGSVYGWESPDPQAPERADFVQNELYTGMRLGQHGNIPFAAADYLQKQTGRDVYILTVHKGGTSIAEWLSGGEVETELNLRVAECLATPELANVSFADVILWHQGEADYQNPSFWRTSFDTVKSDFQTKGWADYKYSNWVLGDFSHVGSPDYSAIRAELAKLDAESDEKVRFVRANQFLTVDNVHFASNELNEMGFRMGSTAFINAAKTVTVSAGGGSGFWESSGDDIYNSNTGNVGIGLTDPAKNLDVKNRIAVRAESAGTWPQISIDDAAGNDFLIFYGNESDASYIQSTLPLLVRGTNYLRFDVQNTERMRINADGNVGIGVNAPTVQLDVNGGIMVRGGTTVANSPHPQINSDGPDLWLGTGNGLGNSDGNIRFDTNATEHMRIDSNGNVGIGTTAPDKRLVVDPVVAGDGIKMGSTTNPNIPRLTGSVAAGLAPLQIRGFVGDKENPAQGITFQPGGAIRFQNSVDGGDTNIVESMRIDPDGLVGIGTNAPDARLHVYEETGQATLRVCGNNSHASFVTRRENDLAVVSGDFLGQVAFQGFTPNGTARNSAYIRVYSEGTWSDTSCPSSIRFSTAKVGSTAPAEHMRIGSDGTIMMGTTNQTGQRLHVRGQSTNATFALLVSNSATTNHFGVRNDGFIWMPPAYDRTTAAAANMHVASNGYVYRSTSSRKYKENISDATWGLSQVLQLRPITFNSKNADDDNLYAGFIAEEVHDVGLYEFVEYTKDGKPDALHYSNMVSLLTKAIQELAAEVAALKGE